MKKITKIKAILLAFMMLLGLIAPTIATAQRSDGFFKSYNNNYENRTEGINDSTGSGIQNDSFGVPLGSGLLILTTIGAGYAMLRRKKHCKDASNASKTAMLLVLAMLFGMPSCKKKAAEPQNIVVNKVKITLDAGGNGNSKHTINTTTGAVTFQDGDVIYVGDGSHYIGTLTRNDGVFSGNINEPADNTEIYFYFVGNLTPSAAPSPGSTSSFTVDISDQSSQMPVLSCNHVTYNTGVSSYSCKLQNKCALVKFTTTSTSAPVLVGGLYTEAKIDFANNGITNNGTTGFVALKSASSTEKWAVLLPQTSFSGAEGVVADQGYTFSMPTIEADAFLTSGISFGSTSSHNRYLQWAATNLTLQNGDHVYGTLASNYKVSIADGATVTLNGVSINASGTWTSGDYAGLTCEGDAIIILSGENILRGIDDDYPGIHINENKTLTIRGTGSLDASGNPTGYCYSAGIGGAYSSKCGNIVIEGGTITATGGNRNGAAIGGAFCGGYGDITISGGTVTATAVGDGAGIGSGYNSGYASGNITILGGTVTAMSQGKGAGIGSGYSGSGSVGNILISGGTITATGGDNAAGIGSGYYSSCGGITIESTVTSVTATKGSGAPNSIGAGNSGTCGTVTIGGVVGAISISPYTYEPTPEGALSGKFTINPSGDQVYFSQGNLKYSAGTWSFHTNQYDMCFTAAGDVSTSYNASGTFDLFGYGTSGYDGKYPYMTGMDDYYYEDPIAGTEYDWGVHNTISNGGTGWRTLTQSEWSYLLNSRSTTSGVRYAKATVNGVAGLIILPDDWSTGYYDLSIVANSANSLFNETYITLSEWSSAFEAHGAVFLPVFRYREDGTIPVIEGYISYYWSSTYHGYDSGHNSNCAYYLALEEYMYDYNVYSYVATNVYGPVFAGSFVRLVKDAN